MRMNVPIAIALVALVLFGCYILLSLKAVALVAGIIAVILAVRGVRVYLARESARR